MKHVVTEVLTAAVGATAKESAAGGIVAAVGITVVGWLGGWDVPLKILAFCLVADYVTGVLGAIKTKSLNAEKMFWGGIRKGVIIAVICFAVLLDDLMSGDVPVFRTMAIFYYIGREGLSVTVNAGILGAALPDWLVKTLEQMRSKGEGK